MSGLFPDFSKLPGMNPGDFKTFSPKLPAELDKPELHSNPASAAVSNTVDAIQALAKQYGGTMSTGVLNTQSIRPWDKPTLSNQLTATFTPPSPSPPKVLLGLNELDIDHRANLRIKAEIEEVTGDHVRINLLSWADTVQYSSGCAWLRLPLADHGIQSGQFSTEDDHPWDRPQRETSRKIAFEQRYAAPPKVVVWLNALDVSNGANCRVNAYATDITQEGFNIHIDSWADTILYMGRAAWIAYPAERKDIHSGTFSTNDVRPWNQPRLENSGKVSFGAGFHHAPQVFMALNTLDIDRGANLRIKLTNGDVTAAGMTWHLDSWADTVLYSAGASFIAFDNDC